MSYDNYHLNHVASELEGAERAYAALERQMDKLIYENRDLKSERDALRLELLGRADAAAIADDDIAAANLAEILPCAWDLVNAAERMRMHWAETPDPDTRNRELWTPLHSAADVLRERLDLIGDRS